MDINTLKALLSVQNKTGYEIEAVTFITNYLQENNYHYSTDEIGNIFVTKGDTNMYPLLMAHTDGVHPFLPNGVVKVIKEELKPNAQGELKQALKAYRSDNNQPTGISGDDLAGVFTCLMILDQVDYVKILFAVSEENGCIGSKFAVENNPHFFENCSYSIQFDSPENNTCSYTLMDNVLCDDNGEFNQIAKPIMREFGITEFQHHPYTDAMVIREELGIPCLNIIGAYYQYHTPNEYVIIEDIERAIKLGTKLINSIKTKRYNERDFGNEEFNYYSYGYDDLSFFDLEVG